MYCRKCGTYVPDNVNYCIYCAEPLHPHTQPLHMNLVNCGAFGIVLWLLQSFWLFALIPSLVYQYGTSAAAGFISARPTILTITFLNVPLSITAAALVDKHFHKANHLAAKKILRKALILIVLFSVIETVLILFFCDILLDISSPPPEAYDSARSMLQYTSIGFVFLNVNIVFGVLIYWDGHPVTALIAHMILLPLSFVFAHILLDFALGVATVCLSAGLANFIVFLFTIYYFSLGTKSKIKII